MAIRELRDMNEMSRQIIDGEVDEHLESIAQAVQARKRMIFRPGTRVRLHGTRNVELDGAEGVVMKVNAKRITVGIGEYRDYGFGNGGYEKEYNVPTDMLTVLK